MRLHIGNPFDDEARRDAYHAGVISALQFVSNDILEYTDNLGEIPDELTRDFVGEVIRFLAARYRPPGSAEAVQ